jgi:TonB family protein
LASKIVILFAALSTTSLGAQTVQDRGEAMLSRARAVSDIRHKDAPAFRLKVEFSFLGDDLEQKKGTFTEWWVSTDKWRRETESGGARHLEIGGPYKIWLHDTGDELPEQVKRLPSLVAITPPPGNKQQFDSIIPLTTNKPEIECAITIDSIRKEKGAFCFHTTSGVVIQKIEAFAMGRRVADYRCDYGGFREFGEQTYPREMACRIEGHQKLEARVVDLSAQVSMDPGLFTPPVDAVEVDTCPGKFKMADPKSTLLNVNSLTKGTVTVGFVIDVKGNTQNVRVVHSAGEKLDDRAVKGVRSWRFSPATCDGDPIQVKSSVQIDFVLP